MTARVRCHACGDEHPARYSHEGEHGEGAVYAVTCTDGLTDYYLASALL